MTMWRCLQKRGWKGRMIRSGWAVFSPEGTKSGAGPWGGWGQPAPNLLKKYTWKYSWEILLGIHMRNTIGNKLTYVYSWEYKCCWKCIWEIQLRDVYEKFRWNYIWDIHRKYSLVRDWSMGNLRSACQPCLRPKQTFRFSQICKEICVWILCVRFSQEQTSVNTAWAIVRLRPSRNSANIKFVLFVFFEVSSSVCCNRRT